MRFFLHKRILFFLFILVALLSQGKGNLFLRNNYLGYFNEAYSQNPMIPRGFLEAFAYHNTRLQHIDESFEESCVQMPKYWGVMGLIENGKGVFYDNLYLVAELSGYSADDIKHDPRINILAFAKAYNTLLIQNKLTRYENNEIAFLQVLMQLSELPAANEFDNYVRQVQLYGIVSFLNDPKFQDFYNCRAPELNMEKIFGKENLEVLSSTQIDIENDSVKSNAGTLFINKFNTNNRLEAPCVMPAGPVELTGAIWDAAAATNYGGDITPDMVAIHTMQGSYAGSISWFKNTSAVVSAQYCVRSYDGQVTQMVCNRRKAYHVGNSNSLSVGIEQEAYQEDGIAWFTNAMYLSVANITNNIAVLESVDKLKTYNGPPISGLLPLSNACWKIKGHQMYPSNTHIDPGPYFDWERFYRLINPLPALFFSSTAASGIFYDAGGASGNYADADRKTFLIDPSGNAPVSVTFTSWNVESGFDFLYVYDGIDNTGRFIGKFSASSPGTLTGNSGALFFEFRSDCATNLAGWVANWNTLPSVACGIPTDLTENVSGMTAQLSWTAVAGATLYEGRLKGTLESTWTNFSTTANSFFATGLESNAVYQWEIRARCGTDSSGYVGSDFNTTRVGHTLLGTAAYTVTNCSGDFRDSGGKLGSYGNREDWTYTIQPAGATAITITFSSFNTESTDLLRIYDGSSTSSTLIGTYSGTTSPGTIVSTGGALTFRFTSDSWTNKPGWEATWTCTTGVATGNPVTDIQNVAEWNTANFNVAYKDSVSCASGIKYAFYQVENYNGTDYRSNTANGFFNDDFNLASIASAWTVVSGTWSIATAALYQSNQVSTNTNIYSPLTQTNQTYLYHFKMKINGSGTNKRAGIHFFCDDATQSNRNNSYLVYFRDDNNTVQIYKCTANVISAPLTNDAVAVPTNTFFDVKIIYNPTTGVISVFMDDILVSSYTDASPLTSGSAISFRTGECEAYFDNFKVYKTRGSTTVVSVGSAPSNDITYQNINPATPAAIINTLIIDNCNKWSALESATTNIDWTLPLDTFHVNDGVAADIDTSTSTTTYFANWTPSSDINSGIVAYSYMIGTAPGTGNLIALTDNGNSTYIALSNLNLIAGTTYYITVFAENAAGLISNAVFSDGVYIKAACTALPTVSTAYSPHYNNWITQDFTATFTDNAACACPLKYSFYNLADYNNTEWRSNGNYGFLYEDFDNSTIHADWNSPAGFGTWSVNTGQGTQTDETLSNTNLYASIIQNNSHVYLYEWTMTLDGVGGNRRAGMHFFCDNPTWPNRGNSYFVWFRADQDNMQIYKTSGATSATNVFGSVLYQVALDVQAGVPYNVKVIYAPQTGTITVYRDNIYIGQWTDASPLQNGNSISLRTGNSKTAYDGIRVYKSRTATENAAIGATNELRYINPDPLSPAGKISTLVIDTCKHFSNPDITPLNIDTTKPNLPSGVNDGLTSDMQYTTSLTTLSANWSLGNDINSDIAYYEFCIGTSPGDSNTLTWTSAGNTTQFTQTGLSLLPDTTYYVTVRARNNAGLYSVILSSNGITVTLILPLELIQFYGVAKPNANMLYWQTANELNSSHFEIERSINGYDFNPIGTVQAMGTTTVLSNYSFTDNFMNTPADYYYRLKIVDMDNTFSYSKNIFLKQNKDILAQVFPNPFQNEIQVQVNATVSGGYIIQIFSEDGRLMWSKTSTINTGNSNSIKLDLHTLANGMYWIKLMNKENTVLWQQKIIKQ